MHLGTCFVRYMRENVISEGVISEVHCNDALFYMKGTCSGSRKKKKNKQTLSDKFNEYQHGQTDRQTKQKDRQTDRLTNRQNDRPTDPQTETQTDRLMRKKYFKSRSKESFITSMKKRIGGREGQTDRPTKRQTNRPTDQQTDRQADRPTDRQTDKPTDRQINEEKSILNLVLKIPS